MHLRSGLDKSSERESRSQPAQAPNLSMDEYHFTEFDSNGADVGSSRQNSGSPSRSETQNHETTNEQHEQDIVLSSQYEGYQETPIASSHHTQRPCLAPPSFYDPALYSEASAPVLYPTTSASFLQPYTTTTTSQPQPQLQHNYSSYMPSHTNAPQPESIYAYDASPLPYPPPPPPPAAPTPPPLPPHLRGFQPPPYDPQDPLPYHQAQNQYDNPPTQNQTHQHQSIRPNFPPLLTPQMQGQAQQQPHHQSEDDPWSPLSARETRKRRASNALSNAELGVSGADVDRGDKDKMGQELDSLERESRSVRMREGNGEGSARYGDLGRNRRRRLNNGNAGRRRRREDEDENENEVEYEARMARGEEEDSDRGNGHAYS
ncbi:hypothetical protein BOTCAL_0384g00070 [Botryotinia calthae]|uniref:Uncharacterized protein n=1 Tax=Botryotinia calthae TaxID=38488 RepID=A0A4Y8CRC0_9HELO|nr:hypothetical protein BOTCAL_0384g00070 [Botryotinia calthae]